MLGSPTRQPDIEALAHPEGWDALLGVAAIRLVGSTLLLRARDFAILAVQVLGRRERTNPSQRPSLHWLDRPWDRPVVTSPADDKGAVAITPAPVPEPEPEPTPAATPTVPGGTRWYDAGDIRRYMYQTFLWRDAYGGVIYPQ